MLTDYEGPQVHEKEVATPVNNLDDRCDERKSNSLKKAKGVKRLI